jgi:hypothetical protein
MSEVEEVDEEEDEEDGDGIILGAFIATPIAFVSLSLFLSFSLSLFLSFSLSFFLSAVCVRSTK